MINIFLLASLSHVGLFVCSIVFVVLVVGILRTGMSSEPSLPCRVTGYLRLPGNDSEDPQKVALFCQKALNLKPLIAVEDAVAEDFR